MAFSFSNWFKKPATSEGGNGTATAPEAAPAAAAPSRFPAAPPAPAATPPARPSHNVPSATRTLKTVVPNSVRPVNLREGMARPGGPNPLTPPSAASLRPGASAIPTATRPIAFPVMSPAGAGAPPAPAAPAVRSAVAAPAPEAPAFHAAPDAKVTIPLGEFFDRVPANLLRPGAAVDRERAVVFQASDLYSDLARGRASVPVSAVQTACPDLFSRPVSPTEDVEVALPLQRVIEQLASTFQARPDQVAEEDVAEIETPFLQVALEDSVRLPRPPAPPAPLPRATVAPVALPARNPLSKTGNISGNEAATIRALTPRQTPSAPHAPAQAAGAPNNAHPAAAPGRESTAPINAVGKRAPSTVRASVAGGKIRLSGPAISSRSIAPAAAHSAPAPLAPSAPASSTQKPVPAAGPAASAAAMIPAQKKTARIQIPAIALRPAGSSGPASAAAPGSASRPAAAPVGSASRAVPFPEPLVSFRATPGEAPGTPPPPAVAAPSSLTPPPPTRPLPGPGVGSRPAGGPPAPPPMLPFAPVAFTPPPPAPFSAPAPAETTVAEDDSKIFLAVAPILRTLPDTMFADGLDGYGAAEQVPDDAKAELPLGFITTQLAQGRVAVPRAMFVAAMPASCRHLMLAEGEPSEVLIPLQEVFQNLPTGALSRRHDQLVETIGPEIPTPFSQKAQEDAQRLAAPPAPEPELAPEPEPEPEPVAILEPVQDEAPAFAEPTVTGAPEPEPVASIAEAPAAETAAPATEGPAVNADPEETAVFEATPEPVETETVEAGAASEEVDALVATPEAPTAPDQSPAVENERTLPVGVVDEAAPASEALTPDVQEPTAAEAVDEPLAPEPLPLTVRDLTPADPADAESLPIAPLPEPALPASNGQHHHPDAPASVATPSAASREEDIQDALRTIFMVDEDLDAKKVVRLASSLPGLKACAVMFGDGLKLAGELEDGLSSDEGFCAMTPPFFRRVRTYASELGLGETQCVTLQTERALLSLFMAGDICLSVQHVGTRPFLPGVREKLLAATAELARMYATPVSSAR